VGCIGPVPEETALLNDHICCPKISISLGAKALLVCVGRIAGEVGVGVGVGVGIDMGTARC
jgi:hypothetical protein